MLTRRLASNGTRTHILHKVRNASARPKSRRMSTWAGTEQNSTGSHASFMPALNAITTELDRIAPRIDVDAAAIEVIEEPKDFFLALKQKILNAQHRIYIATLYIGRSEHELIDCIRDAAKRSPRLKISILTDALRGTREAPDPSCASLLSGLAAEFPSQVEIRMYHTPNLTGIRKKWIPRRLNEGWGLQHMKLYGIDNEIILSGANLSEDYFTNRQDRYHLFASSALTNFYANVQERMCRMSFLLQPRGDSGSFDLIWPRSNACISPLEQPDEFIRVSKELFQPLVEPNSSASQPPGEGVASVYPILIIPRAVNNELPAISSILAMSSSGRTASCLFTAGYFNPHPLVATSLLEMARSGNQVSVITASPWANGFYGSKGVSGMLPAAYTLLSRRFLASAANVTSKNVELKEWRLGTVGRPHGWTYHAKGLWLTFSNPNLSDSMSKSDAEAEPLVTVIGSSNYTVRSYTLDTEAGAVIVTSNGNLKQKYKNEEENLLTHTKAVSQDDLRTGERRVGPMVRIAMWIVRAIGGSL